MSFISVILSEGQKVKRSLFWKIHIVTPIIGAALFVLYFVIYHNVDEYRKMQLILELIAMAFPLLIGIIIGINIMIEEKSSHFQSMLAVPNRINIFMAKLFMLFGSGILSLICMSLLFVLSISILGVKDNLSISTLVYALIGIAFVNFTIYVWHLFVNLKFGQGISLFLAVFECLQCVLYSNIELQGMWRYIPFSWSINWIHDILNGNLLYTKKEWGINIIFMLCFLTIVLKWFEHWEGRKSYE